MIIPDIIVEMEGAQHPVAKALHKDKHFKVLVIGFKKGMRLEEHISKFEAKFTVLEGKIGFGTGQASIVLDKFHDVAIPVGVVHWFEAQEDSLCLLTQAWDESVVHENSISSDWDY